MVGNIITLCIPFAVAMVAALRHDVQMFQQNSYRYSRYFKWLRSNILTSRDAGVKALFVVISLISYFFNLSIVEHSFCRGFLVGAMISYILFEFSKKFKVKIAYTSRVKRLLCTSFVLAAAISVAAFNYLSHDLFVYVVLAQVVFSNLILLMANALNSPLEWAITAWYINDARKIISSHNDLIVIGVTGSYGKTSTKNYLYRMLSERYNVLVTPGNYNTLLGVVRTIREQLRPQHQVFIVEMGAKQRGDIKEICDLVHPKIGIVTSVGEAHLETFKSVLNIQKTKFELIDSLPKDGFGVVNLDSENIKSYDFSSQCPIVSYSIDNKEANVVAQDVQYNSSGVSFNLPMGSFKSPLLGGGNVLNLLAGIVVSDKLGVSTKELQRAIQQLQGVEHRLSLSRAGGLTILDDAYNSNPAGAKMALDVLRDFARPEGAKRVVITPGFVEMGANQFDANYELGRQIAFSVDYAVVVNRLNREAIVKGLCDSDFASDRYYVAENLNDARAHLASRLSVGDVLLYENDLPDSFK